MEVLKLEFNDKEDTILYLRSELIGHISICRHDIDLVVDELLAHYVISLTLPTGVHECFYYDSKQDRDIDYEYAIKQIDILMNVNREEF